MKHPFFVVQAIQPEPPKAPKPPRKKSHLCPHYDRCLTRNAYRNIDFNCSGCPHENDTKPIEITRQELAGCLALLLAIFNDEPNRPNLNAVDYYLETWAMQDRPYRDFRPNDHRLKDPVCLF